MNSTPTVTAAMPAPSPSIRSIRFDRSKRVAVLPGDLAHHVAGDARRLRAHHPQVLHRLVPLGGARFGGLQGPALLRQAIGELALLVELAVEELGLRGLG
ncbi:MAG: hypothetical protein R2746_07055 [Acidimicrobiales bacterium]